MLAGGLRPAVAQLFEEAVDPDDGAEIVVKEEADDNKQHGSSLFGRDAPWLLLPGAALFFMHSGDDPGLLGTNGDKSSLGQGSNLGGSGPGGGDGSITTLHA